MEKWLGCSKSSGVVGTTLGLREREEECMRNFSSRRPRSRVGEGETLNADSNMMEGEEEDGVDSVAPRIASLRVEKDGVLALVLLPDSGARERERWTREDDRRRAVDRDGLEVVSRSEIFRSWGRGRDRERDDDLELAMISNSSSPGEAAESPSSPHPMPQATSSTIAIVQRLSTDLSRHPCRTCSAPWPMPAGTS
jgi:hypothetical protein